ncbi:MAG: hypothetical protein JJE13_02265 [Thermoleophilia bacterium]|nr:hypothetical protein [Thermoleophilia bacterium]
MGELGVRLLRVYTILPPRFYEEFARYNRSHQEDPIYLLHGAWIPEEGFLKKRDAFAVLDQWKSELTDAVDVVHGDADIPDRPGHASGSYRTDVSRWLLGWSVGVEWDPAVTIETNRKNAGMRPFEGRYIRVSSNANPMESWIAAGMDHVAGLEAKRGWSRPITFTNWLTTDPLQHPTEPAASEDAVSIDPMNIAATAAWPAGVFASYHVYPYYPDFLRWEYQDVVARDGQPDPYVGYLRELKAHHRGMPVMVTEFGVPSSIGLAHLGPLGRNQGGHSEQEAGDIDAGLLRRIQEEGFAGGVLFEWTDEWFKITWNTLDLEKPDGRKALWRNVLTNEEHFGVLAVEPGREPTKVLDGDDKDWSVESSQVIAESRGPVSQVRASHDAEYLWLKIGFEENEPWMSEPVFVGLSVSGEGNRGLPGREGVDPAADHGVVVGPGQMATLLQASWLDPLPWLYGIKFDYVPFDEAAMKTGSGEWSNPRQILNRPLVVPGVGPQPAEFADASGLRWGTGDSEAEGFDQRNLVMGKGSVLELRLPWGMIGYGDPSSHQVLRGRPDGTLNTERTGRVGITVQAGDQPVLETSGYDWDDWNSVDWHERRKAGWSAIADEMSRSSASGTAATGGR